MVFILSIKESTKQVDALSENNDFSILRNELDFREDCLFERETWLYTPRLSSRF